MTDGEVVPFWLLSGESSDVESSRWNLNPSNGFTEERVVKLRNALEQFADAPLVIVEAHPMPGTLATVGGRYLKASSQLATEVTKLVQSSSSALKGVAPAVATGETLFRMLVSPQVATQLASGAAKSMSSTAVNGGIHSAIRGASRITSHATFVPVSTGTAATGGAAAAGGVAAGGLLTVAAPLALILAATALQAYAEEQQRRALERIENLLHDLTREALLDELYTLKACSQALDKASAIFLDQGPVGHSLGLGPAVHEIDTAVQRAAGRLALWKRSLDSFEDRTVSIKELESSFTGLNIKGEEGQFQDHLRLAVLAISLKRRLAVLQAVEHIQMAPGNVLVRFAELLGDEAEQLAMLEGQLVDFLSQMEQLQVRSPRGLIDSLVFTQGDVDKHLKWQRLLREVAGVETPFLGNSSPVEVNLVRHADGALTLLPGDAAAA